MEQSKERTYSPELVHALRLNLVKGIGPRSQQLLLSKFGSHEGVFRASLKELTFVRGIGDKLARSILEARNDDRVYSELERCKERGVRTLTRDHEQYPFLLNEISDPPEILYHRGSFDEKDEISIGIVGSRTCSLYGQQQAEKLAAGLARAGVTVVSGLARGIDGCAHRGALNAGGRTMAVMATGLANVYPPEHRDLMEAIVQNGAILSESPLDQEPLPGLFPQRNRIISGLSLGVVIVEAAQRSGALHTARHAMEQNRDVFAVPGRIDHPGSAGCLDLLKDGAILVRSVDDILNEIGDTPLGEEPDSVTPESTIPLPELNEIEASVFELISRDPQPIDRLLQTCPLESSQVLSTLTLLEMKRIVVRLPGGYIARKSKAK